MLITAKYVQGKSESAGRQVATNARHNARTTDRRTTLKGMASHAEKMYSYNKTFQHTVCRAKLRFVSNMWVVIIYCPETK